MADNIKDILQNIEQAFPKSEPIPPSQFAVGVAEQLRDLAAQIETGDLVITHFSLTINADSRQKLEIEVA